MIHETLFRTCLCKQIIFSAYSSVVQSRSFDFHWVENYIEPHYDLFVCFVALCPKSTAMVMAGRSVHLTTLFPEKLKQAVNQYFVHILWPVIENNPSWMILSQGDSAEGRRMTVEIISWSISTKVWDRARIKLTTPGSAVRLASVARHVTDSATLPGDASW